MADFTAVDNTTLAFLIESTKSHINAQISNIHSEVKDPIVLLDRLVQVSRQAMHINTFDPKFVEDVFNQIDIIKPISTTTL